jgi:hypothetical protein
MTERANTVTNDNGSTEEFVPLEFVPPPATPPGLSLAQVIRRSMKFIFENYTPVFGLLYVYSTGIGIVYSYLIYSKFGINIFDYSEIGDFLLAAIKYPGILLWLAFQLFVSPLVMWFFLRQVSANGTEEPAAIRARELVFGILVIIVLLSTVGYVFVSASNVAADTKKPNEPSPITVRYLSGSADEVTESDLRLIGATQKVVFFYDAGDKRKQADDHTLVIPQARIVSIGVPE